VTVSFLYGYGREFELEADRSGLRYAILAGYDPDAMESFFRRMDRLGNDNLSGLGVFLRTHPPTPDRIRQIKKILSAASGEEGARKRPKGERRKHIQAMSAVLRSTSTALIDNFSQYQDIIRSLPKKDAEFSGVIQGKSYRNADLGVALEMPDRWKMEHSYGRTLLAFSSPDGKAQGELISQKIQPDPLLTQSDPELSSAAVKGFAGVSLSTLPITAKEWAEGIEQGLKFRKRTGREVVYPAGPAYSATYEGMDRVGRPAFFKIVYVIRGNLRGRQRGFLLSFAAPADSYLDYLVDAELISKSLRWTGPGPEDR
jgi:hypothetical protein